jgi:sortase A
MQGMVRKLLGDRKRLLSYGLMFLGVALLTYVAVQYGTMFTEQRRLAKAFDEQQRQQKSQQQTSQPSPSQTSSDGLTRISIPKISLQAMVVEGTSRKELLVGLGHLKQTPIPGEDGNAVLTAHRDTFFRHIHELSKGDEVMVQRGGKTYRYEVTGKKIVNPDDVSVLRQSGDKRLTLITCYPTYFIGPAPERLVVFAKLKEQVPTSNAASAPEAQIKTAAASQGASN